MSRSPRWIVPEVGARKPVSRLNSVVLPAPLGPTSAWTLPSATSRSTPLTAAKPRNSLVSARVRSSAVEGAEPCGTAAACVLLCTDASTVVGSSGMLRDRTGETLGPVRGQEVLQTDTRRRIVGPGPHILRATLTGWRRRDAEARLLELLAAGASAADIAAVDADPVLRDLALQVRAVTDCAGDASRSSRRSSRPPRTWPRWATPRWSSRPSSGAPAPSSAPTSPT